MGEYAEMMLDGTCCAGCGEFMGDSSGYPGYCSPECAPEDLYLPSKAEKTKSDKAPKTITCKGCSKLFASQFARDMHWRAKHAPKREAKQRPPNPPKKIAPMYRPARDPDDDFDLIDSTDRGTT